MRAASRLTVKACLQGLPPVQSSCRLCSGSAGREQRARCTASGEVREYQSVSFFPPNTPRPTHTLSCPASLQGLRPGTGSALMTFLSSRHWHCGISAAGELSLLRPSLHPSLEQQCDAAVILCLSNGERGPVSPPALCRDVPLLLQLAVRVKPSPPDHQPAVLPRSAGCGLAAVLCCLPCCSGKSGCGQEPREQPWQSYGIPGCSMQR